MALEVSSAQPGSRRREPESPPLPLPLRAAYCTAYLLCCSQCRVQGHGGQRVARGCRRSAAAASLGQEEGRWGCGGWWRGRWRLGGSRRNHRRHRSSQEARHCSARPVQHAEQHRVRTIWLLLLLHEALLLASRSVHPLKAPPRTASLPPQLLGRCPGVGPQPQGGLGGAVLRGVHGVQADRSARHA
jgi:hypothetical protein